MDQCSMFQELTKTCTKHQISYGSSISCQLNRLKGARMQMNRLNCLRNERNQLKCFTNEMHRKKARKKEDEPIET